MPNVPEYVILSCPERDVNKTRQVSRSAPESTNPLSSFAGKLWIAPGKTSILNLQRLDRPKVLCDVNPTVFMRNQSRSVYASLAVLFVVTFLAFSWAYGYVIAFKSDTNDCFFLFGRSFLLEFLDHPAGPVRYAGRFLGQFYHYRWLGALIIAACVTGFGLLFSRILAKQEKTIPLFQVLLPCILLLALHASTFFVLQDTLGLCTICCAFWGYLSLPGIFMRRSYALVVSPIVYLLAGVYAGIFVAWVVASESFDSPRRSGLVFSAGCIVLGAALPFIAWRWVFPIPLRSALICPVMFGPPFRSGWSGQSVAQSVTDGTLAVGLCGVLLLVPFWSRVFYAPPLTGLWNTSRHKRTRFTLALSLVAAGVQLHWIRYDAPLAKVVACRQFYKQRQWDALLQEAKENPYGDHRIQFMTNFALYHKGELLDKMFSYPQPRGTRGLFLNFSGTQMANRDEDDTDDGMYNSDLLYEMGHVNFALQHAYNNMSLLGKTYETLARMAECSMVNGNEAMARKYLNLLKRTLFHRDFARRYEAILADPDAVEEEFGAIRERLPIVDGFGHPTRHFLVLLQSKPDNRMAIEYLMAWLLLEKTPDAVESICADIGHLRDVGLAELPRHCQEAMLLKAELAGAPVDTQGFRYDDAVAARVAEFRKDMSGQGNWLDPETAAELYGDTYMFYWFFATTPTDAPAAADLTGRYSVTLREE